MKPFKVVKREEKGNYIKERKNNLQSTATCIAGRPEIVTMYFENTPINGWVVIDR